MKAKPYPGISTNTKAGITVYPSDDIDDDDDIVEVDDDIIVPAAVFAVFAVVELDVILILPTP